MHTTDWKADYDFQVTFLNNSFFDFSNMPFWHNNSYTFVIIVLRIIFLLRLTTKNGTKQPCTFEGSSCTTESPHLATLTTEPRDDAVAVGSQWHWAVATRLQIVPVILPHNVKHLVIFINELKSFVLTDVSRMRENV